jgi:hypothetical protein
VDVLVRLLARLRNRTCPPPALILGEYEGWLPAPAPVLFTLTK